MGETRDLERGAVGVRGVRVGHGLDHDRVGGPDEHPADVDGDRRPAQGPVRVRRRHGVPPPNWRATSNTVIQIRKVNRATNPIAYVSCSARSEIRLP